MVISQSPIDSADVLVITLNVDIAGQTASGTFTAELICNSNFCDPAQRTPNNFNAVDCNGNGPKTHTGEFTSSLGAN